MPTSHNKARAPSMIFIKTWGEQGQPEGEDLALPCPTLERKPYERPVSRKNRDLKASFRSTAANQPWDWMHLRMRICVNILNGSL